MTELSQNKRSNFKGWYLNVGWPGFAMTLCHTDVTCIGARARVKADTLAALEHRKKIFLQALATKYEKWWVLESKYTL